jgi:hypothetical protein
VNAVVCVRSGAVLVLALAGLRLRASSYRHAILRFGTDRLTRCAWYVVAIALAPAVHDLGGPYLSIRPVIALGTIPPGPGGGVRGRRLPLPAPLIPSVWISG